MVIAVVSLRDLKFRNVYFKGIFMNEAFQKHRFCETKTILWKNVI